MSPLKDLIVPSSAGCAPSQGAPLSTFVKHLQRDSTPQQDRFIQENSSDCRTKYRSPFKSNPLTHHGEAEFEQEFKQHFLGSTSSSAAVQQPSAETRAFHFGQMNQELDSLFPGQPHGVSEGVLLQRLAGDNWATDFLLQTDHSGPPHSQEFDEIFQPVKETMPEECAAESWHEQFAQFERNGGPSQLLQGDTLSQKNFERAYEEAQESAKWETEFGEKEADWVNDFDREQAGFANEQDTREALSKTAGMLIESVDTSNPKFKNSQFLGLMQKLRDQEVAIEGNKVVNQTSPVTQIPADGGMITDLPGTSIDSTWVKEFEIAQFNRINKNNITAPNAGRCHPSEVIPIEKVEDGPTWATDFESRIKDHLNRAFPGGEGDMQSALAKGTMYPPEFSSSLERTWSEEFQGNGETLSGIGQNDWSKEFKETQERKEDATQGRLLEADFLDQYDNPLQDWVQEYQDNIDKLGDSTSGISEAEWATMSEEWNKSSVASRSALHNYKFAPDNPFLSAPVPVLDGLAHQGASILMLEAKVQADPKNAMGWYNLGMRQQENEQEPQAIAALRRAVDLRPDLVDAWQALAVSYTNLNYKADAYDALEKWLDDNTKYSVANGKSPVRAGDFNLQGDVARRLLNIARSSVDGKLDFDPDVQVCLGILFNLSEEYDKAADCFEAALSAKPQDYLLWNKLGASFANSGQNERAVDAYFHSLEINPMYTRARYNLAVSCVRMGQHQEAVEHLLSALTLQRRESSMGASSSINIWDTLKMSLMLTGRPELAAKCDHPDPHTLDSFRNVFDFEQ